MEFGLGLGLSLPLPAPLLGPMESEEQLKQEWELPGRRGKVGRNHHTRAGWFQILG